jgi:hypothetical protein
MEEADAANGSNTAIPRCEDHLSSCRYVQERIRSLHEVEAHGLGTSPLCQKSLSGVYLLRGGNDGSACASHQSAYKLQMYEMMWFP